jgi:hypothetical protein
MPLRRQPREKAAAKAEDEQAATSPLDDLQPASEDADNSCGVRRLEHDPEPSMRRTILPLLLVLGQFSLAAAPRTRAVHHPPSDSALAAIVTAAHQAAEAALKAGVPAVQVAVSRGGQIIYSEAFGVTEIKSATAATSRSVMQIGSVTKQFTAAAILRLAEHGVLTYPIDRRLAEEWEAHLPKLIPTRGK